MWIISTIIASDFTEGDFTEASMTEKTQEIFLAVVILLLGFLAWSEKGFRIISTLMALFFLTHLFREMDDVFDARVFDGFWQLIVWTTVAISAIITIKNFRTFIQQLAEIHERFSFAIILTGLVILHIFSRLYGRTTNWSNLMQEEYLRTVKDASEESIELLAYSFILIGVLEMIYYVKKNRPLTNSSDGN
ncbi:MAG: hypothetical protein EA411_05915 [Saprospirales bacterium]|nr:MAG: hypothetical protein EA411_05915 [Saprospirales bacterium]